MEEYISWDRVPDFFPPRVMAKVLGIGEAAAYALVRRKGFPALKNGHRYIVYKEGLKKWIEKETGCH